MDLKVFTVLVQKNEAILKKLAQRNIRFVADVLSDGYIDNAEFNIGNAEKIRDEDASAFSVIINADFLTGYPHPVLIDLKKAIGLYADSNAPKEKRIESALLMSRVNFMGTDGIRGKVVADGKNNDCVTLFVRDMAFTPGLVRITSYSFAKMCIDNGIVRTGDAVVIGNDGRDKAFDWVLNKAVCMGLSQAGLTVYDCGVVPTAIVPYTMLKRGIHCAAMLTASHNPSNQNGIKFFIDGKKMLPEGECGDYVLSAYMYAHRFLKQNQEKRCQAHEMPDILTESKEFIRSVLPAHASETLKGTTIVLDNANGAFAELSRMVLRDLAISFVSVNEAPIGANINLHCGVAEIEGTEFFYANDLGMCIPFVRELFSRGRASQSQKVFGIALDGDGDRGFVLFYDKEKDLVAVLDGDKCGYIIAQYYIENKKINPKDYWFVSTIESDIMTAVSAQKNFGLHSKVVSVGDKWIGGFNEGNLLVGLEISGHCIVPLTFTADDGKKVSLVSGIGLLTGLLAIIAIKELKLSAEKIVEPFESGFSKTFYTFFVDKTMLYRNSPLWNADRKIVANTVQKQIRCSLLPADTTVLFEDKEDPNVLYITLNDKQGLFGCVFVRNSGTEDKTAVYVKGRRGIQDALLAIGKEVQAHHIREMKNKTRIELLYENRIMKLLEHTPEIDLNDIKIELLKECSPAIGESDLHSIVHALKKEGRINVWQAEGTTKISKI